MHHWVNLICIYFFAHKSTITACCSLWEDFSVNVGVFNVYKQRQSGHHHKTHSCYSELNVYLWFLVLEKLTEWCCFVPYLSNNPRTLRFRSFPDGLSPFLLFGTICLQTADHLVLLALSNRGLTLNSLNYLPRSIAPKTGQSQHSNSASQTWCNDDAVPNWFKLTLHYL